MDKAAIPSVKPLSEISLSAQSNPSECCGRASGAGSDRSTSVFAGVECLEDDLEDPGFGGVSWSCKSERTVASKSPPGNSLPKAVSKAYRRSSTYVKCLNWLEPLVTDCGCLDTHCRVRGLLDTFGLYLHSLFNCLHCRHVGRSFEHYKKVNRGARPSKW